MSSSNQMLELNVKKEKDVDRNWGGIPPSILLEETSKSKQSTSNGASDHFATNRFQPAISTSACNAVANVECEVPAVDSNSVQGKFGWTKVNNVDIPFILRGTDHYVSVRMIELKLLKVYFETLPMNLFTIARVNSEYVTANEATLLNEINVKHCECKFGKSAFTRYDLIVQEDAVKEMCEFLNNCHLIAIGAIGKTKANCGLATLGNVTVPFVISENSQWVPMDMVPNASSCAIQMTVSKWQMGYLKYCCSLAKFDDSVINESSKIVRAQDIASADGANVKFEELNLLSFVKTQSAVESPDSYCDSSYSTNDATRNLRSAQHSANGFNHQQWMMCQSVNNTSSSHMAPAHQRQSPVAPASKSMYLPPYSPNSPLLAPSPQQLSPSVEPVGTPPYSHHHLSHMTLPHATNHTFSHHHVPSSSVSNNPIRSGAHSSSQMLYESLQSNYNNTRLPKTSAPQESHGGAMSMSTDRSDASHKRNQDRTTYPYNYRRSDSNSMNPEFISLPSSYVDMDEFSSPPKKSLPSRNSPSSTARSMLSANNFVIIPDPIQIDERFPAYSVSQVILESCMLPAVNTKAYVYNEGLMVPLFYVSYKFFPKISLEVCQQALKQILGVNIFIANKYIVNTLGKVCRLPQLEEQTSLIRWADLEAVFAQLRIIMNEISRKLVCESSSEHEKHLQLPLSLNKTPQLQTCNR